VKKKTSTQLMKRTTHAILLSVLTLFSALSYAQLNRIEAIDFKRGEQGEGQLLVNLENRQSLIDVRKNGNQIIVEFLETELREELIYTLDVLDFATPVSYIKTSKEESSSKFVIDTLLPFRHEFSQQNGLFRLSVFQDLGAEQAKEYIGDPISLDFQNVPIRQVLQIIASHNNFNLVTTDTVTGDVSIRLDSVPWDQALDVLLKIKGLDKRIEGKILLVAPAEEIANREAQELQMKQQVQGLEPLQSEFVQVNYAKAADIANLLKGEQSSLLTDRGAVSIDERTNTLLVRDTRNSIEDVKRIVRVLDVPVRQVVIESRIVTVNDNITDEMGIRWGVSDQNDSDGFSGSLAAAETISNGIIPALENRLNVNMPVANVTAARLGVHVARLADGTLLDLELSALESENKGEIIASPRITTANQKEAYIEQGTEIPYVQAASSGATSVTFKKAVLSLQVTPHITPDNRIILDLIITQDTRGDTVSTPTGPAVAIDTQEISTQVLVDNGETIVLGGIYQQQETVAVSKVPLLGDIPYLGRAFKQTRDFDEKKELLIFVTPKIVMESL
jgi:type IV pilus assembly protein PilQ